MKYRFQSDFSEQLWRAFTLTNNLVWRIFGIRLSRNAPIGVGLELIDPHAAAVIKNVFLRTMTDENRIHNLILATRYISENKLKGDIVECGVWRGGSMMAIAETLVQIRESNRVLYLFDTYSGMTEPSKIDKTFKGELASKMMQTSPESNVQYVPGVLAFATLADVKQGMETTGYPSQNIVYVQGDVAITLKQNNIPEEIAILRLDTDWHESTKIELETLWPRLVEGGILILDDYDHWVGAKKAVDEFFASLHRNPFMMKMSSGRIIIK